MAVKKISLQNNGYLLIIIPETHERLSISCNEVGHIRVSNDKCPHRGGPLHLCKLDSQGNKVCPWHGRKADKIRPTKAIGVTYIKSKKHLTIVRSKFETLSDIWPIKQIEYNELNQYVI